MYMYLLLLAHKSRLEPNPKRVRSMRTPKILSTSNALASLRPLLSRFTLVHEKMDDRSNWGNRAFDTPLISAYGTVYGYIRFLNHPINFMGCGAELRGISILPL